MQYSFDMSIDGPAVRRLRELSGWSVRDFAKKIGKSPEYVRNIESGARLLKRNPALIKVIAEALGVHRQMIERSDI